MISRKSKIIIGLAIFLVLLSITVFFFNQFNSNNKSLKPGYGAVSDSQFQIETEWYQNLSTGYENSAKLNFNGSTGNKVFMVMIDQYKDRSTYEAAYESQSQKINWHIISAETENREGFEVKTILVARNNGQEIIKNYFFEKNGKYYQILIDVGGTSDISQFFTNDKYQLDKTINTIIRTIN